MGTFFELGKDRAAKGEGWAPPFISCAQVTVGTLTPTAPMAIRLWDTFTFTLTSLLYDNLSKKCKLLHTILIIQIEHNFSDSSLE